MTGSPLYQLRDVRKSHSPGFALEIDRLDIESGEILGLLGPTGAGKSTLLRLLAGLEAPEKGDLWFDGHRLAPADVPLSIRRRITMVHQRPLLLTGTVRFNVEYGLRLRRVRASSRKVDAILDRTGLKPLALQSAQTLSGGQTQLVAVARALVVEPDVLLLDEATANLDPAHVELVESLIRDAQQERGMTVVWTTHNLFQARRIADRTALLLNGTLIELALTSDLFQHPSDPRTADFIQGRMVY